MRRGFLALTAAATGLLVVAAVARLSAPVPLPAPSRGRAVAPCPDGPAGAHLLPPGTASTLYGTIAEAYLRAAGVDPLWCGNRTDEAYRFGLVYEWGETKVVTIRRSTSGWRAEAIQFQHTRLTPGSQWHPVPVVQRRVSRPVSPARLADTADALAVDNFWMVDAAQPDSPNAPDYDGPLWIVEARTPLGYR